MTTSPPTLKISTFSLSKGLFVVTYKVGSIVGVFDVVPSIPLRFVSSPMNKILYCATSTFLYYLLIK